MNFAKPSLLLVSYFSLIQNVICSKWILIHIVYMMLLCYAIFKTDYKRLCLIVHIQIAVQCLLYFVRNAFMCMHGRIIIIRG